MWKSLLEHHRRARLLLLVAVTASCARGGGSAPAPAGQPPAPVAGSSSPNVPAQPTAVQLYRSMGLLAEGGDLPFVGSVAFLAGSRPDSTLVLLTVSLSNQSLAFAREGEAYRADYSASVMLQRGSEPAQRIESREAVRVATFRETARADESILFQHVFATSPGVHALTVQFRDDAANRASGVEATLTVPRLDSGSLSSPIPFYQAALRTAVDSVPRLVPTPRATVTVGQDSVMPVYLERYGTPDGAPVVAVVTDAGRRVTHWSDTVALVPHGALSSAVFRVPVSRIGVGASVLSVMHAGRSDTVQTPIFVSFGDELPVASFEQMLQYLRYFTSSTRLSALRDAGPDTQSEVWAEFLRATDPNPQTPRHEGLAAYFGRIQQANARFREGDEAGWLSDRGRVFVAFGSPDQVYEPNTNDLSQRGRTQIWDYQTYRLRVVFVDQSGFGRWRMTMSSESEFEVTVRREIGRE
jgi:GWxTD domain-containing protein